LFSGFFLPELRPGSPAESLAKVPDTNSIDPNKNKAILPTAILVFLFKVFLLIVFLLMVLLLMVTHEE
jgi:hypothetical protein